MQSGTVGYWIDQARAGQGLIAESVVVVAAFAFEQLDLHRLEICIVPRNNNSRRVMEKLAIREEGIALRFLEINGVWEDHVRYGFTVEEWADAPRRALAGGTWSVVAGVTARRRGGSPRPSPGAWRVRRFHIFSFQWRLVRVRLASLSLATSGSLWCAGFQAAPGSCTSAGSSPALTWLATSCSSTWIRCRSLWAWARSSSFGGNGASAVRWRWLIELPPRCAPWSAVSGGV